MKLYNGEELKPLRFSYKDFCDGYHKETTSRAMAKQEQYWLSHFEGVIPVLNLPLDHARPSRQSFEGDIVTFEIGEDDTAALNAMALNRDATLYMVLLSVFNILLAKLSDQQDIIIGTPVAGRGHDDLQSIIGMFVNTLALRNFPGREKSFTSFLAEVKERTLTAFENQYYPFEELVDHLLLNRDTGRNPLFDVMFALQKYGNTRNRDTRIETQAL